MTNNLKSFLDQKPYLLAEIGNYKLYEHPTRPDTSPVYLVTPSGNLIRTKYRTICYLCLGMCREIEREFKAMESI